MQQKNEKKIKKIGMYNSYIQAKKPLIFNNGFL